MSELVWERPEPPARSAPTPLSRERIVAAACALADAEGLEAVSLRKVGAALGAGPMRLYGYLSTKDELLDLMADAVYGELPLPEPGTDRRGGLRALAHAVRTAAHRHEWFADLLGGRPGLGPNALAYLEASLAAADEGDLDDALVAVHAVHSYVTGAVRSEITELRRERESGQDETQWQRASAPYLRRMLATGRYPTLARAVDLGSHPDADTAFDTSLTRVLDGLGGPVTA
ncbi:TetR/AcrR family transcriptional regulator C-terminal domain-containing protein [Amycolatopsis sp. NPDC049253]|uniref:TetR/AcrR family transcriptional regulator C-terminal domain-containing protein n=1 Tax=Amycolatopsis sp. NPDC049253 TaxID=3155274 RepID=UPI003423FB62